MKYRKAAVTAVTAALLSSQLLQQAGASASDVPEMVLQITSACEQEEVPGEDVSSEDGIFMEDRDTSEEDSGTLDENPDASQTDDEEQKSSDAETDGTEDRTSEDTTLQDPSLSELPVSEETPETDMAELSVQLTTDEIFSSEQSAETMLSANAAAMSDQFASIYQKTGNYLYQLIQAPTISSIGGEWTIIGLARSGYHAGSSYYSGYASRAGAVLESKNGVLHERKYTEYARVVLALTAIGYDVTNVAGYNLLEPLADFESVIWQGINGPIWALIALDSHNYPIPATASGVVASTREKLVQEILNKQTADGGWSLSGSEADTDLTAMALQALVPYRGVVSGVSEAVERGIAALSALQNEDGGFGSYGTTNSESCSQVLVALCALGIDPETDARFLKDGVSVLDVLLTYAVDSGGFCHVSGGAADGMATEQAYYALTAYQRYLNGQNRLYDMTDVVITGTVAASTSASGSSGNAANGTNTSGNNNSAGNAGNDVTAEGDFTDSISSSGESNGGKKIQSGSSQNGSTANGTTASVNGTAAASGGTRSLSGSSGGTGAATGSTAGTSIPEGKVSISLDGKTYVVSSEAQKLIEAIGELAERAEQTESSDQSGSSGENSLEITEDVVQLYLDYQKLSDEQKADVLNYGVLEDLMEETGERIHCDEEIGLTADGLPWYVSLSAEILGETETFYQELQKSAGSRSLLAVYKITLTNLLLKETYSPEQEITLHLKEKEASTKEAETVLLLQCTQSGTIQYIEGKRASGVLTFTPSDFPYFGILETVQEATLSLEDESDEPMEAALALPDETEDETSESSPVEEQKHSFLWLWIVLICLASNGLVLGFLGSRGWLRFEKEDNGGETS